jgi:hypothetical protein
MKRTHMGRLGMFPLFGLLAGVFLAAVSFPEQSNARAKKEDNESTTKNNSPQAHHDTRHRRAFDSARCLRDLRR